MPHRATPGKLTIYGDSRSGNCLKGYLGRRVYYENPGE